MYSTNICQPISLSLAIKMYQLDLFSVLVLKNVFVFHHKYKYYQFTLFFYRSVLIAILQIPHKFFYPQLLLKQDFLKGCKRVQEWSWVDPMPRATQRSASLTTTGPLMLQFLNCSQNGPTPRALDLAALGLIKVHMYFPCPLVIIRKSKYQGCMVKIIRCPPSSAHNKDLKIIPQPMRICYGLTPSNTLSIHLYPPKPRAALLPLFTYPRSRKHHFGH